MYRRQIKIPTLLGMFILFSVLGGIVYFDRSLHTYTSKAKMTSKIEDIHFTNITDNSFTVSWFTDTPTPGIITVSDGSHTQTLLDDLDSDNIQRPRQTHYITVKNLKENTSYTVKIINKDRPTFTQKTASKLASVYSLPPARGTLFSANGKPAEGAIVYLVVGQNLPLSGRVDSAGLWVIPLSNLRSQNFQTRVEPKDEDIVQITAKLTNDLIATAITDVKSIRQNFTIPPMVIGNSYNFTNLQSKKDLIAKLNEQRILGTQTQMQNQIPTPTSSVNNRKIQQIDLLFPLNDGDTTVDPQPRIRGVGIPKKVISITINSPTQSAQVTVNSDGTWFFRPSKPLAPGSHTVTIKGYDASGKLVTITRKFTVLKSGESVLGEATAAASLTPSPSPIDTPTPTITTTPTLEPTITSIITPSPLPTVSITIAPRSGNLETSLMFIGSGVLFLLLGIKFFLNS